MAKWVVPPNSNAVTWCLVGVVQRWLPSQRQCKASCVHVWPMQTHKPPQTWPTMLPPQQPTRLGACKGPRSKVGGTMAKVGNVLPMWAGPKRVLRSLVCKHICVQRTSDRKTHFACNGPGRGGCHHPWAMPAAQCNWGTCHGQLCGIGAPASKPMASLRVNCELAWAKRALK